MSDKHAHAKMEFKAAGYIPLDQEQEDGPNKWIQENVLELLDVFSAQGHSGFSAPYCVRMFEKLALHKPLTPLTGEDWEWTEVGEGQYQNKRCSHVFKNDEDGVYDIEGRVSVEYSGSAFSSKESFVPVTFPYTPSSEFVYIKVSRSELVERIDDIKKDLANGVWDDDVELGDSYRKDLEKYEQWLLEDNEIIETASEEALRKVSGERFTILRTEKKCD